MTRLREYYTNITTIGDNLCVRGVRDGEEFSSKVKYKPTLYIESDRPTGFTNIYGTPLKPLEFEKIRECRDFAKQHANTNLRVYGYPFFNHQYALETYGETAEADWKREEIRVYNIDIEVTSDQGFPEAKDALFPVTAICIHDSISDKFITFGMGQWFATESELPDDILDRVVYIPCANEHELMTKFMRFWQDFPPAIVTGWNVEGFDIPYLFNRLNNIGMKGDRLSPWNLCNYREYTTMRGEECSCKMLGIDTIDYLDRYRKNKIQESYRLGHIAHVELGQAKLDFSEEQGLHTLFYNNFQKFIDYNIQDVNLVKLLDEKLGLIDVQLSVAYKAGVNPEDVSGVVKTWDALVNKELRNNNQVPPWSFPTPSKHEVIPGGYVKEPQVGKHGWVCSFDLNSLYPHLIMQYNISPETLNTSMKVMPGAQQQERIQKMIDGEMLSGPLNHSVSASGWCFDNTKEGIIPRLMRELYDDRKRIKKEMIAKQKRGENAAKEELTQYVIKILLNSGYGALTNKYYRWYDQRMGESITLSGQYIIRMAEKTLNGFMNKLLKTDNVDYVIAIDTDSNYLNLQPLVDKFFSDKPREEIVKFLDKVCKDQIDKALAKTFDEVADYQNCFAQKMVMEREAIASSAFWTAKKRYAMMVWDNEGVVYEKGKVKIQGLEAIRSSTPQSCRDGLLKLIDLVLMKDEQAVQNYIKDFRDYHKSLPLEEVAFPRSMNSIREYTLNEGFKKGTPPHVRGAIQFNRMLKRHNLTKEWESIKDGEKGKFVYLYEPNSVGTDVISYLTSMPEEFDVRKYVNYDKMFEKTILDPMKYILEPIGWEAEKTANLMDFFG